MRLPLELIEMVLDDAESDCDAALVLVSHRFRTYTNRVRFNYIDLWSDDPDRQTIADVHAFYALLGADTVIWAAHPPACLTHNIRSLRCSLADFESGFVQGHHINNLRNLELMYRPPRLYNNLNTWPRDISYRAFPHLDTLTLHSFLPTFMGSSRMINTLPLTDSTLSSIRCLNLAFDYTPWFPPSMALATLDFDLANPLPVVDAHLLALHTKISASGRKVEIMATTLLNLGIYKHERFPFDVEAFKPKVISQIRSILPLLSTTQDVVFRPIVYTKLKMFPHIPKP